MKQPPNPGLLSPVTLIRAVIAQAVKETKEKKSGAYQRENAYGTREWERLNNLKSQFFPGCSTPQESDMITEEKLEPADSKSQVQITRVLAPLAPTN